MFLGGAANNAGYIAGVHIYMGTYMFLFPLMIGAGAVMDAGGPRRHTGCRDHLVDLCHRTGLRRLYCYLVLLCRYRVVFLRPVPAGRARVHPGQAGTDCARQVIR